MPDEDDDLVPPYFEEDVTEHTDEQLGSLIRQRIRRFPAVEVFRRKISRRWHVILRTWRVEVELVDE